MIVYLSVLYQIWSSDFWGRNHHYRALYDQWKSDA